MIEAGVEAILIKVASLGLEQKHLGLTLAEAENHLHKMVNLENRCLYLIYKIMVFFRMLNLD